MPATLFLGVYFLFLLQLLTEFIAAIYTFGLLGTSIPPEIGLTALILSPFALLLWRKPPRRLPEAALGVALVARLALPWLSTRGVLWIAGIGTAAALLALPLLFRRFRGQEAALGMAWAVAAAGLLRALGAGVDLSLEGTGQIIAWILALAALWGWRRSAPAPAENAVPDTSQGTAPLPFRTALLAALGVVSALFLLYAAFAAPAVIARWVEWPPLAAYTAAAAGLLAFALTKWRGKFPVRGPALAAALALFALLLGWGIASQQTPFPKTASAYPFPKPAAGFPWDVLFALLLFPLIFPALAALFDWLYETQQRRQPAVRTLGAAFGLASFYLILLIFAHVFTTTYDYIPVVGPLCRDRFWVVSALPAAVLALAVARVPAPRSTAAAPRRGFLILVALALAMPLAAFLQRPHVAAPRTADTLRVLTYNIQQGYRADGQKGWHAQAALMGSLAPDLIGLQESDTARISGANNDLVGYFATALDMEAVYSPPTVDGTFGLALLSRYPILASRTVYLYSEGEQTAALIATIAVGARRLTVVVTHLGNDGPMVQQENLLQAIAGQTPLVLMGDFNFRPDTPQYRLTARTLPPALTAPPENAIDHIFLTPDLTATEARYIDSPASDHPALFAVIRLP